MDSQIAVEDDEANKALSALTTVLTKLPPDIAKKYEAQLPLWKKGTKIENFRDGIFSWVDAIKKEPGGVEALQNATIQLAMHRKKEQEVQAKLNQQQLEAIPAVSAPAVGQSNSWDKINNPGAKF